MAQITTPNVSVQHFTVLTGTNDIWFTRTINSLILTTTGTVNMSFDGTNFMGVTAGTIQLNYLHAKQIFFTGAGTYAGVGLAL